MRTASLHMSWVFKESGASVKKLGIMYTNHLHGTCFLNKSIILFTSLGTGEGQILWTTERHFIYASLS